MYRRVAAVLLVSLVTATIAWANAGPAPLPKGRKIVHPPVRFVGIDKHPDHVFCLYYGAVHFKYQWVVLKDSETVKLIFDSKGKEPGVFVQVMALERTEFEKRKKADPTLEWFRDDAKGVLHAQPDAPEATAPIEAKDVPLTTYRVEIKNGKLHAEKVAAPKTSAAPPTGLAPSWVLALALSLSLAWFGMWLARR